RTGPEQCFLEIRRRSLGVDSEILDYRTSASPSLAGDLDPRKSPVDESRWLFSPAVPEQQRKSWFFRLYHFAIDSLQPSDFLHGGVARGRLLCLKPGKPEHPGEIRQSHHVRCRSALAVSLMAAVVPELTAAQGFRLAEAHAL